MIENFQSIVRHLSQEQFEESKENFSALTKADSIYQAYTENPDLPHECLICKKTFSSFKSFNLHFGKMHKNSEIQESFRNV